MRILVDRRGAVFLVGVVVCVCVRMKVCRAVVCVLGIIPTFTVVMVVVMKGCFGYSMGCSDVLVGV